MGSTELSVLLQAMDPDSEWGRRMEFFAQAGKYSSVSTNPYVYEAGTESYVFIGLCVLEFLFKIVFSILLMTNDDFQNCSYAPWIFFGSIALSFYFLFFVFTNRDLTIQQRYGFLKLLIHPVVYIAGLNIFAKIFVAYDLSHCSATPLGTTSLPIDVTSWSGWMVLLILASVAIDGGLLWIGTHYDVKTYDPNKGNFLFKKTRTFEERDGPLSIIESGSFRIILQNLSPEPFTDKSIEIKRKIGFPKEPTTTGDQPTSSPKKEKFTDVVRFTIKLDQPINPGHMLTVIPETHNDVGAIKIRGYRAFAPQVSEIVLTRIRTGTKLLSRLHENYVRALELTSPPIVPEAAAAKKS